MSSFVEIITSPNCPHSPRAVRVAQKVAFGLDGVVVREVSTITQFGAQRAEECQVQQTPTILIDGQVAYIGVPPAKRLKELLSHAAYKQKELKAAYF